MSALITIDIISIQLLLILACVLVNAIYRGVKPSVEGQKDTEFPMLSLLLFVLIPVRLAMTLLFESYKIVKERMILVFDAKRQKNDHLLRISVGEQRV